MIVEEQGIDFRTGVRFPSAPLLGRPHNYWKIQCLCGFLIISECTKRKPKRLKKRLFSGQISHEVSHEKRAKKASKYKALRAIIKHQKRNDRYHTIALNMKTKKRTQSTTKGSRVRFCDVATKQKRAFICPATVHKTMQRGRETTLYLVYITFLYLLQLLTGCSKMRHPYSSMAILSVELVQV